MIESLHALLEQWYAIVDASGDDDDALDNERIARLLATEARADEVLSVLRAHGQPLSAALMLRQRKIHDAYAIAHDLVDRECPGTTWSHATHEQIDAYHGSEVVDWIEHWAWAWDGQRWVRNEHEAAYLRRLRHATLRQQHQHVRVRIRALLHDDAPNRDGAS